MHFLETIILHLCQFLQCMHDVSVFPNYCHPLFFYVRPAIPPECYEYNTPHPGQLSH